MIRKWLRKRKIKKLNKIKQGYLKLAERCPENEDWQRYCRLGVGFVDYHLRKLEN